MDKQALDRWITKGPDTRYQEWYERVWDLIPEDKISAEEYDANMDFFDDGMNAVAMAGANGGFPEEQFTADVMVKRFKYLKGHSECKTWVDVAEKFKVKL